MEAWYRARLKRTPEHGPEISRVYGFLRYRDKSGLLTLVGANKSGNTGYSSRLFLEAGVYFFVYKDGYIRRQRND